MVRHWEEWWDPLGLNCGWRALGQLKQRRRHNHHRREEITEPRSQTSSQHRTTSVWYHWDVRTQQIPCEPVLIVVGMTFKLGGSSSALICPKVGQGAVTKRTWAPFLREEWFEHRGAVDGYKCVRRRAVGKCVVGFDERHVQRVSCVLGKGGGRKKGQTCGGDDSHRAEPAALGTAGLSLSKSRRESSVSWWHERLGFAHTSGALVAMAERSSGPCRHVQRLLIRFSRCHVRGRGRNATRTRGRGGLEIRFDVTRVCMSYLI